MARLIDLGEEEDVEPPEAEAVVGGEYNPKLTAQDDEQGGPEETKPNAGLLFSAALTCYPVVTQLARYLDLNSLHELSSTCRQFRANLLQFRTSLIDQTLRCVNENAKPAQKLGNALHASHKIWTSYGRDGVKVGRISGGKVGACAHDMVGACRACGDVVCRNCIVKAPSTAQIMDRLRRLCRTCMKCSLNRLNTKDVVSEEDASMQKTLWHASCSCSDQVWICQPCGQSARTADTMYLRGWKWRDCYSQCGGMGAGLGEGDMAVRCGNRHHGKSHCLVARAVEQEIECDAEEIAAVEADTAHAEILGHHWEGSSYSVQETVGVGGVLKKKVKKAVDVGAEVKKYEDERSGKVMLREQSGANRSWCSWCSRVVPGKKDLERSTASTESFASSSSGSS